MGAKINRRLRNKSYLYIFIFRKPRVDFQTQIFVFCECNPKKNKLTREKKNKQRNKQRNKTTIKAQPKKTQNTIHELSELSRSSQYNTPGTPKVPQFFKVTLVR